MSVFARSTRRARLLFPAACLLLASVNPLRAGEGGIQQTAGSCSSCPTAGCCPSDTSAATTSPDSILSPVSDGVDFAPLQGTLLASDTVALPGYIDSAIPRTALRIRFDSAFDNNRPDRAEYFYAKCGCFRTLGIDPSAAGPVPGDPNDGRIVETSVDYRDIRLQLEYALAARASFFIELPFRFLNPEVNDNTSGFGDLNLGLKYALVACPDQYLTFQFRAYAPTGDSFRGLGTDHYSIEPGLLYYRQLSGKLSMFAEIKDWIPIDGNDGPIFPDDNADFAGNVWQYGVGFGYEMYRNCCTGLTVSPLVEFVGWSVLDGLASTSSDGTAANIRIEDAADTIINSKIGVRVGFGGAGSYPGSGEGGRSLYVGWGHALTSGDRWYEDIVRVEYRVDY